MEPGPGGAAGAARKLRDRYLFDVEYVGPRTPMERWLAELWSTLLDVDRVGANDDFFDLDGDSLLGLQVLARVRGHLGVELPLRALFDAPTVAQLSVQVESRLPAIRS